jgi:DNA polymerase I-like protein with 3'-5' exonuclease and polymerase domains
VVATPGWVLVEADFKSAELFVLAALSQDKVMWDALTTPGMDLHDLTAIKLFA